jgi:methylenetetrahydrofolate dehydrogenase (NADP+)/methenyltetrahydrofolate cyclohydrolase
MILLDGKKLAKSMQADMKITIAELEKKYGKKPTLACVIVGDNPASLIYIKNKVNACNFVGMNCKVVSFKSDISEQKLMKELTKLSNDKDINGIILQMPLPAHINARNAINAIHSTKDVDGLTSINLGKLVTQEPGLAACTAQGIITLLEEYDIPLSGKNVVIVGRSLLVGKPLFHLLLNKNATVTICHSLTQNLVEHLKRADIIVSAAGHKDLIYGDMVKQDVILVDVSINRENNKLYGDVNVNSLQEKASYLSPVPGGVGPMTVTTLLQNTLTAFVEQQN